jgi:hypothetical protein
MAEVSCNFNQLINQLMLHPPLSRNAWWRHAIAWHIRKWQGCRPKAGALSGSELNMPTHGAAALLLLLLQNPEHTGNNKSYAKSLRSTAAAVEYLQLDVGGPVPLQELPQAYHSSSSSSSSGEAAADDAYLRFSVKFRPRDGGREQVANEISHFKRVDGEWLYFNEVDV